jgi:hypothetical protein
MKVDTTFIDFALARVAPTVRSQIQTAGHFVCRRDERPPIGVCAVRRWIARASHPRQSRSRAAV